MKNHLSNFREGLTFDFFDLKGLNDYVAYLREVKEMRNSTIGKQLACLKWFCVGLSSKECIRTMLNTYKPKLKSTQKKIIFLT